MSDSLLSQLAAAVALLRTDVDRAIEQLRALYSEDLRYESPIQQASDRESFLRLVRHMATRWVPFSLEIDDGVESATRVFGHFRLTLSPRFLSKPLAVEGITRCVLRDGKISQQRDYYDALTVAVDSIPFAGVAYRKIIRQFSID
jgi:ketosteroid isomerase-like protein